MPNVFHPCPALCRPCEHSPISTAVISALAARCVHVCLECWNISSQLFPPPDTLLCEFSIWQGGILKGPQPPVYTLQCFSVPFKINPKSEHKSQSPLPVPYSANISLPLRPQLICRFLWGSLSAHNSEFSHSQTSSRGPRYFLGTDGSILHRGCIIICLGSLALWGQGPCLH